MNDKCFFDTTILVYANDSKEKQKQEIARNLIKKSLIANNATISVQVLSEFWVTVTQKIEKPLLIHDAEKEIELFQIMEIVSLDYPLFKEAIQYQKMWKLSYWDSLIVAASSKANCKIIYSEDLNHGQIMNDMKICNPFIPAGRTTAGLYPNPDPGRR